MQKLHNLVKWNAKFAYLINKICKTIRKHMTLFFITLNSMILKNPIESDK